MISFNKEKQFEIIVPVSMEIDDPTIDEIVDCILEQKEKYSLKRFMLVGPSGGWRSVGYPDKCHYEKMANKFLKVKERLTNEDVLLGWWEQTTLKAGRRDDFQPIVKNNGLEHPFSNCPLCENFSDAFAKNVALFAKIAKPEFIMFEDDYSINAAAGGLGCFCPLHLKEFEKREGKRYEREELVKIFAQRDNESIELFRRYRELTRDSMVQLSKRIREELDKESPEIPIGLCQPGSSDLDGDSTVAVCKALAGKNHKPFCRFHGAYYNGGPTRGIPEKLYSATYSIQHIKEDFGFYHESDTFPHTRFFTSVKSMKAFIGTAYSQGFKGSLFQTQQILDDPTEEKVYGHMLNKERARLEELIRTANGLEGVGVELPFDPFFSTIDGLNAPYWTRTLCAFGIPFVTTEQKTAFIDERQAKYCTDEQIKRYLSQNLFLDGDGAKALCERGYAKYIGVEVGQNVASNTLGYDLGARERIIPPFDIYSKGKNMPIAHMFANGGNGILRELKLINDKVEVISEAYTFQREFITTAMTRFENQLGGKVVVMGMTLKKNASQSLYNYRRMKLFSQMLLWCDAKVPFIKDQPDLYLVVNKNNKNNDFSHLTTIINLGEDNVNSTQLYLPKEMRNKKLTYLDIDGKWKPLAHSITEDGIVLEKMLESCEPLYIKFA